jgi:hypothetical protein
VVLSVQLGIEAARGLRECHIIERRHPFHLSILEISASSKCRAAEVGDAVEDRSNEVGVGTEGRPAELGGKGEYEAMSEEGRLELRPREIYSICFEW